MKSYKNNKDGWLADKEKYNRQFFLKIIINKRVENYLKMIIESDRRFNFFGQRFARAGGALPSRQERRRLPFRISFRRSPHQGSVSEERRCPSRCRRLVPAPRWDLPNWTPLCWTIVTFEFYSQSLGSIFYFHRLFGEVFSV